MFQVSKNGIITVNRGDTFTLPVSINLGSVLEPEIYLLNARDKVYFGLTEPRQPFEHAIIRKEFSNVDQDAEGIVTMKFDSTDTEYLIPGKYYYSVKLFRYDENAVDTIISKTQFFIID